MSTKEVLTVRPPRKIRLGEIPASLPSVYDAVNGEFGAPNLVKAPLMIDYQQNEHGWFMELDDAPEASHVHAVTKTFINAYVNDMQHGNTDWDKQYKQIAIQCAQGWLREEHNDGAISVVNIFAIPNYLKALKAHLQKAEKMWGVEWLTSDRPLVGQNDREIEALGGYLEEYYNTSMTSREFFLNLAGDILINQIRLASTPEQLEKWRVSADKFAKSDKRKKK